MADAIVFEERSIPLSEVRADASENGISGHAVVFNQRTAIGDPKTWGFFEEVAPGATARTIAEADIAALVNHNSDLPLARTSAGTLTLAEDGEVGLRFDVPQLPATTYAGDLRENVRTGNIVGMSYAFRATKQEWSELEDGTELRRITEMELREISPVTFPAFGGTDVGLRDAANAARETKPGTPEDVTDSTASSESDGEAAARRAAYDRRMRTRAWAARIGSPKAA